MADPAILGLPDFNKFNTRGDTRTSHRRRILSTYPNGGAPLTGILSMIKSEPVDSIEHTWYEKRYRPARATVRGTNPITSDAPSTGDADDGTNMTTGAKAITVAHHIKVDSISRFAPGQIFRLSSTGVQFRITAVTKGVADEDLLGYIRCYPVRAYTAAATDDATGTQLEVIGSAHGEGATGNSVKASGVRVPVSIKNITQIARDAFYFPGSVLQQGMEWDKSGPYKEKARDTIVDHMVGIELATIFGQRSMSTVDSLDSTQTESESLRTMSGIIEFLSLWDAGSDGAYAIDGSNYNPYNTHVAATADTDDLKRVITNTAGTVSVDQWNVWAERVGRYHTNRSNEKLVLCGSGAINAMHKMFRVESSFNVSANQKAYGLNFTTLHTPYGDFHFVLHPLFNENANWRNYALILDVHSMRFRPLRNRDTALLKNRQSNGDDFRKDEYLTEFTLEFWHPENSMLIKNIQDYTVS